MLSKPVVQRSDILTRKCYPVDRLLRIALIEGKLYADVENKLGGRGIYILKDPSSLEKLRKKNVLMRYSKITDFEILFEEVKNAISKE